MPASPLLALAATEAAAPFPSWHPHPGVWLVVLALGGGYAYVLRRVGPNAVPGGEPVATTRQKVFWYLGVALLWLVSGWPIHDIAEESLFIFHMIEHLVIALGVAPLLLLGTPRWLAGKLLRSERVLAILRQLSRPLIAFFLFNAVLAALHVPAVVELMVTSSSGHFVIHGVLFASASIMWMPVLSPLQEIPRLRPPLTMLYLFAHSLIPTVPASFLTFTIRPLYRHYAEAARLWGIDPVTDQAVAGLIMKLAGGLFLWIVIAVIWFRWYRQEQEWDALERELRRS